jgi:simple sugar transport system permease protein
MPRVAIVRRELPMAMSALAKVFVILLGMLIAVALASTVTRTHIDIAFATLLQSLANLNVFVYISTLLPIAVGLCIAFSANAWNLGAEGQLVMGAVGATFVALYTPLGSQEIVAPIVAIIFAALLGALWALPAALLKMFRGVNEALTALLMNFIAYYITNYLVKGPWRGRAVYGYPTTDMVPRQARIPMVPGYSFSWYVVAACIAIALLAYLFLYKTRLGAALRALGSSPRFVELIGVSSRRLYLIAFLLSGALAGFAGGVKLLVYHGKLVEGPIVGSGYGFTAIMLAWLGGLNPLLLIPASYYTAALYILSFGLQIGSAAIGDALANTIVGSLLTLALLADFLTRYKLVLR